MEKLDFNRNWYFKKEHTDYFVRLNLPHDAMLREERSKDAASGSGCAYFQGGKYIYRKKFYASDDWADKTVFLEFEGVYQKATVYINGREAAVNSYGYSNFFVDLKDYMHTDEENEVYVVADNSRVPNSRWYSGSGIYRCVYAYVGGSNCILPEGIQIQNRNETTIAVDIDTYKKLDEQEQLRVSILDGDVVVAKAEGNHAELTVPDARLWSAEDPQLYTCQVELIRDGQVVDEANVRFGFRTIAVTPSGLLINGQPVLLRGGCIHHDNGILGACGFADAEERRVRLMKEAGFNAIRSSHNPASKALLDACDRLGMYVMDEAFDMWLIHKTPHDYAGEDYEANWKKDVEAMIRKDYSHPSVIMYSIGNEISELGLEEGQAQCRIMTDYVRQLDPDRPVTSGVNLMLAFLAASGKGIYGEKDGEDKGMGSQSMDNMPTSTFFNMLMNKMGNVMDLASITPGANKVAEAVAPFLDISGYNYATSRYKKECSKNPGRVIVGSETLPKSLYKNWQLVKKYPNLIGDFMWTSIDYLGESGIGTIRYTDKKTSKDVDEGLIITGGAGIIDICGKKRPEVSWGRLIWNLPQKPVIAVEPYTHADDGVVASMWRDTNAVESWSWEGCEGKKSQIVVYTDAAKVALGINGRLVEKKEVRDCKAIFHNVPYENGRIVAITYDKEGNKIGRSVLTTATGQTQIKLTAEKTVLAPNGQDLCFVNINLVGENGVTRSSADQKLKVEVSGCGSLQAFGSARPNMAEDFVSGEHTTFYGKALAVVRAGYDVGEIVVKVSGDGLDAAEIVIQVEKG